MPEFNIEVQKTDYGFRVPLPTTEGKVEYDANRFKDNEPGVVTLMSKTGVLGGNVFSLNVSPYRKVGENWVAENLCAGLGARVAPEPCGL